MVDHWLSVVLFSLANHLFIFKCKLKFSKIWYPISKMHLVDWNKCNNNCYIQLVNMCNLSSKSYKSIVKPNKTIVKWANWFLAQKNKREIHDWIQIKFVWKLTQQNVFLLHRQKIGLLEKIKVDCLHYIVLSNEVRWYLICKQIHRVSRISLFFAVIYYVGRYIDGFSTLQEVTFFSFICISYRVILQKM